MLSTLTAPTNNIPNVLKSTSDTWRPELGLFFFLRVRLIQMSTRLLDEGSSVAEILSAAVELCLQGCDH